MKAEQEGSSTNMGSKNVRNEENVQRRSGLKQMQTDILPNYLPFAASQISSSESALRVAQPVAVIVCGKFEV